MALVEFNGPFDGNLFRMGSGKNKNVIYRCNGRWVMRSVGRSSRLASPHQKQIRKIKSQLGAAWRRLSPEQAASWIIPGDHLRRFDRRGKEYTLRGGEAFQAVNMHRLLAGRDILFDPPAAFQLPAISRVSSIVLEPDGRLRARLEHPYSMGSAIFRLRLTMGMNSRNRRASPRQLRFATDHPAESYIVSAPSPQEVVISPRYRYCPGQTLGVEILTLSTDFVPGETLFIPTMPLEEI